jgi:hypothetical protein
VIDGAGVERGAVGDGWWALGCESGEGERERESARERRSSRRRLSVALTLMTNGRCSTPEYCFARISAIIINKASARGCDRDKPRSFSRANLWANGTRLR